MGHRSHFVISTVPADGLALLGTTPSAGTVMIKFVPMSYSDDQKGPTYIHTTLALEGPKGSALMMAKMV